MRTLQVELPDKVAEELEGLVATGWFMSDADAIRQAVLEFVRRRPLDLLERFQREDVAWALKQKGRSE